MAYWQWMDHSKLDRLNLHNTHTQIWTHFKSSTTHSKCSLNPFWTYVVASASRTEQGCTYTTSTQEFRTTISSVSFSLPASQSILIISQPEDIHHEFSFRRGRCQILDDKLKYWLWYHPSQNLPQSRSRNRFSGLLCTLLLILLPWFS